MAYWGVPCGLLSPCCRPLRSRRREAGHSESSNSESETEIDSGEESDGCWEEDDEQPWIGFEQENESPGSRQTGCSCSRYRQKLWHLLEKPETSFPSRLVSIVSISAVMTSLALLCLQSLPFYRLGSTTINTSKSSIPLPPATLLPVLEGVMMAWFSVEFVLRWLASPDRRRFLWKPLNAIDLACLVPFYVEIGLDQVGSEHEENGHELVTLVQTLRVLRTLKLARHSSGVRQLGSAMHLAAPDVAALGLALAVVVCLFASAAYLLEAETGEGLASIPAGIWWALITMTTVGYGDSYPKTVGGKLVAGACVLSGTLAMALPVTVIFGAFHRQYKTKRKKGED
uniref:Potassium voltage-gated channel, delayed-rectifier, subfamily S, member 3b n=1 Tax=Eptatretus burgeri TaxID=7764 RepID=A0A8C4WX81_EPTBU